MASQSFNDWSPASVFGETVTPVSSSRLRSEESKASPSDASRFIKAKEAPEAINVSNEANQDDFDPSPASLPVKTRTISPWAPEEHRQPARTPRRPQRPMEPEEDTEEQRRNDDDAIHDEKEFCARVIQKRMRVWLLYRRELESLDHVDHLRHELESAAAFAITDWLTRCFTRFAIQKYLLQQQRLIAAQRHAAGCILGWYRQIRQCITARQRLRSRIRARRVILYWWRRISVAKKCECRQLLKERTEWQSKRAEQLMRRAMRRYISRKKNRQQAAAKRIQAVAHAFVLHQRANLTLQHLRKHRDGAKMCLRVARTWQQRLSILQWKTFVIQYRQDEQIRHQAAACVLQRLMRVMLTAFRLMRRRDAATKVQSLLRGCYMRKQYLRGRCERRHSAATNIQKIARGRQARKRFLVLQQQLRERFKCTNCGLIEPGGLYCKFCGRRRTTFDILGARVAAASCTTDSKLRKKRASLPQESPRGAARDGQVAVLPPAPPVGVLHAAHGGRRRGDPMAGGVAASVVTLAMALPDLAPPSPSKWKPKSSAAMPPPSGSLLSPARGMALSTNDRFLAQRLPSPPSPRGLNRERHAKSGRRAVPLRRESFASSSAASVEKTRQRAESLLLQQDTRFAQYENSSTMNLHLQRLQKGGKAASR